MELVNKELREMFMFRIPGGLVLLSSLATAVDYKLTEGEHSNVLIALTLIAVILLVYNMGAYGIKGK
ncbi:MAG: hypothetical protein G01um101416_1231 [Microgenomates group bacterium Gr01-1014_16]|nr:MAG: hypothetical protein G01um101416_1231 [Microgenomates group bacterium Gr01-1014_16]